MIDQKLRILFTLFIGAFTVMTVLDLTLDTRESGAINTHVIVEAIMLVLALVWVVLLWVGFRLRLRRSDESLQRVRGELAEFQRRNENVVQAMRSAMQEQFERWNFTETERKIANGLIHGRSLKQIAALYEKSERTVRNQTVSIYEKSGMTGRSDLAAFFLADLFPGEDDSDD
jgi:DNA-binding NarL/FixJ family response regulator